MKYTTSRENGSKIKIRIKFDSEDLFKVKDQAISSLSKQTKIPGFRKGYVPEKILLKNMGEDVLKNEIINTALEVYYTDIIKLENISPIESPKVREISAEELVFDLEVEVYPVIKLGDLKKLKAKKEQVKVEEKEIMDTISELSKKHTEYKEVERSAKKEDKIEIDFEGFNLDGTPFEGGKSLNHPLIIGLDLFIPGFEDKLIGLKPNEDKTFRITFPVDYKKKDLAGKEVEFKVKMKRVFEPIYPKMDDEFAKKISNNEYQTIDELKNKLKELITERKNDEANQVFQNKVLESFDKIVEVDIPQSMIYHEANHVFEKLQEDLKRMNMTLEKYLTMVKKEEKDIFKDIENEAKLKLRMNLGLREYINQTKIGLTQEETEMLLKNVDKNKNKEQILSESLFNKALNDLFALAEKND